MRIAIIDPSLFTLPYDDHLCGALFERGNSVTLFTRPLRQEEPRLLFDYWKSEHFYRLAEDQRLNLLPSKAKLLLKGVEHSVEMASLLRDLHQLRPDVIHFQWLPVPLLDRYYMPMFRRIAPTFLTVHDTKGFLNPTSKLQLAGFTAMLRSFDRLIVHLESSKRELVGQGLPADRIVVIPHGVLKSWSDDCPPEPTPYRVDGTEILAFGAIKPYKGVDILIRAFALLPDELRQRARVVIVGEPFQPLDELQALAVRLGVADRITWDARFVANEEIPEILSRADIIAFPYRRIDASGVLMMTLPYAKPIVATAVGCFGEILAHRETALLAPPEDPKAFAAVLEEALRDPKEAVRIGRAAAALAERQLSWKEIAGQTEDLYAQVLDEHKGGDEPLAERSVLFRKASLAAAVDGERPSYDHRPVTWRGLLGDQCVARQVGELSLAVAFADGKLEPAERELIVEALSEMEAPNQGRRGRARKLLVSMLESLDLTDEHVASLTSTLAGKLGPAQRALLLEVLFLVAISDSHLHPKEVELLERVADALTIPRDSLILMVEGFRATAPSRP